MEEDGWGGREGRERRKERSCVNQDTWVVEVGQSPWTTETSSREEVGPLALSIAVATMPLSHTPCPATSGGWDDQNREDR